MGQFSLISLTWNSRPEKRRCNWIPTTSDVWHFPFARAEHTLKVICSCGHTFYCFYICLLFLVIYWFIIELYLVNECTLPSGLFWWLAAKCNQAQSHFKDTILSWCVSIIFPTVFLLHFGQLHLFATSGFCSPILSDSCLCLAGRFTGCSTSDSIHHSLDGQLID